MYELLLMKGLASAVNFEESRYISDFLRICEKSKNKITNIFPRIGLRL